MAAAAWSRVFLFLALLLNVTACEGVEDVEGVEGVGGAEDTAGGEESAAASTSASGGVDVDVNVGVDVDVHVDMDEDAVDDSVSIPGGVEETVKLRRTKAIREALATFKTKSVTRKEAMGKVLQSFDGTEFVKDARLFTNRMQRKALRKFGNILHQEKYHQRHIMSMFGLTNYDGFAIDDFGSWQERDSYNAKLEAFEETEGKLVTLMRVFLMRLPVPWRRLKGVLGIEV